MGTFTRIESLLGTTPADVVTLLRTVDQAQGREDLHRRQQPDRLDALLRLARLESTSASNAIEGITAPVRRIRDLVDDKTEPRNRSEQEIAGYRRVLDLIHSTPPDAIPVTAGVVRQLHGLLGQYTGQASYGQFKIADNRVEEQLPDGTRRIRFIPVPAWRTDEAMRDLNESFVMETAEGDYHPLLLVGSYVLDFLVIHPFHDGNGRMSRLLTLLLLYRAGYGVGRYVSLERIVAETRETYYETLAASTEGWHDGHHDPYPWLRYLVGRGRRRSVPRVRATGRWGETAWGEVRTARAIPANQHQRRVHVR